MRQPSFARTRRRHGGAMVDPLLAAARLVLAAFCLVVLQAGAAPAQVPGLPAPAATAEPEPAEPEPAAPDSPAEAAGAPSVAEALRLLAIVLDDREARSALVAQLRAVEPAPDAPAEAPADTPAETPPDAAAPEDPVIPTLDQILDPTVPQIIADQTIELAEGVTEQVANIVGELLAVGDLLDLARDYDFAAAFEAMLPVLGLIAVVLTAQWLLRLMARPILGKFEGSATAAESAIAPWSWKFAGLLLEFGVVLVAWGIGHGAALILGDGDIGVAQGIFLAAYLGVAGVRTLVRVVFRPRHPQLRMMRVSDATARHWHFWVARIVGVFGYGVHFLVPLAVFLDAPLLAGWLHLLVVLLSLTMAIVLIVRNREVVRNGLEERLKYAKVDVIIAWLYPLAHYWHLIAIVYLIALFVVWRAVPGDAVGFMIRATLSSAVVVLFGSLAIAIITRSIADGVRISERARRSFPLLESRLNRFVPATLQVLRVVSAVVVLAAILTFWGIVDAPAWLASPGGQQVVWSFLWIATILLLAGVAYILVSSWVEYRLNPDVGTAPTPRERTLLALFSNAFVIVLGIITAMTVLTEVGINIAPLLAGAGVVGLAIGFGAQKLVQDIINGAFIQFENTMNEGDVVTAGGVTGVVEKLTIRSVSLRDLNGHYHMIPFSGVDTVTNFMKGFSFHVAEIDVAYRESIPDVKAAMHEAFDRLMETEHRANILPPLEMQGIVAFLDSGITVRARIKTLPGQQWAVGRAYSEVVKEVFDERDIEIPFPHRTIYMGIDKDGSAPPLNIRSRAAGGGRARQDAPAGRRRSGEEVDNRPPDDLAPPDAALTPPGPDEV